MPRDSIRRLARWWPRTQPVYLCTEQFEEDSDPESQPGWKAGNFELREIMPDGTFRRLIALDRDLRPMFRIVPPTEGEPGKVIRSMMNAELTHRTGWYLDSTEIPRTLFEQAWAWFDAQTMEDTPNPAFVPDLRTIWDAGRSRRRGPSGRMPIADRS